MIRKLLLVLAGALIAVLGVPAVASAHTHLVESNPADGAEVDGVPASITLTFAEDIEGPTAQVGVLVGDAEPVQLQAPVEGPTVTIDTTAPELADVAASGGKWAIAYTVVGQDGHAIDGTLSFTVADAAAGDDGATEDESSDGASSDAADEASTDQGDTDAASADEAEDDGMSPWLWLAIVAVIALVVFGVVKTERLRRKKAEKAAEAAQQK